MTAERIAEMAVHTDAELLDVYIAARTLMGLHAKGGLEQSRLHAKAKADEYRAEILRRMGAAPYTVGSKVAFVNHEGRQTGVVERLGTTPTGSVLVRYRRGSSEWTAFVKPCDLEPAE